MPEPKHQCGTCRYFQNAQLTGNGWCTHPARQPDSDVKILVRERELACRNVWGDDLWTDPSSPATTYPVQETPRRPFTRLDVQLEDEVTSVTHAAIHATPPTTSEDVVTVTSVRRDDAVVSRTHNDVNVPAVDDQAERARMMARGSGPAIRSARERHVQRRTNNGSIAPEPDLKSEDDVILTASEISANVASATQNSDHNADMSESKAPSTRTVSIDHVDSDVGLPRLRNFLLVTSAEQESKADDHAPAWTSQFDHVVRQAERIKQQARVSPTANPSPQLAVSLDEANRAAMETSRTVGATTEQHKVVWDVQLPQIDVAFSRAQIAHDQHVQTELVESNSPEMIDLPLDSTLETSSQSIHMDSLELITDFLAPVEAADEFSATYEDSPSDDEWIDNSPKGSWWRSLNFGLPRRLRGHQPTTINSANADTSYPSETVDDISVEQETAEWLNAAIPQTESVPHQPVVEANAQPEAWYPAPESATGVRDDDDGDNPFELDTPTVNQYVTSEENWMLDEREFPAPQPTEWHDYRAALLASLPPVESLDDAVEWIAATPQSTPIEPLPPSRPLPDPQSFINVDAPGGMDVFLTALFQRANRPTDHFMAPIEFATPEKERVSEPRREVRRSAAQSNTASSTNVEQRFRPAAEPPLRQTPVTPHRETPQPRYGRADDTRTSQSDSAPNNGYEPRQRTARVAQSSGQMPPPVLRNDLAQVSIARADGAPRKCCLTCRSYAPSDEPNRGRCTNEWSKTNRAIVEADDLACHSSLGDWWIAADATWIPPASVIRPHTPRTEELLNDLDYQQSQRGPVRQSKRVRTSKVG